MASTIVAHICVDAVLSEEGHSRIWLDQGDLWHQTTNRVMSSHNSQIVIISTPSVGSSRPTNGRLSDVAQVSA
jgi:hypothetical protein